MIKPEKTERHILVEASDRLNSGRRFALITVVGATGSTPRKEGSRMIVEPDGKILGSVGGAAVERLGVEKALHAMQTGSIEKLELDLDDLEAEQTGMVCGGKMTLMIEPFGTCPRLLMFGAGHVAQPTVRLAERLGFAATVFDQRPEFACIERFPASCLVHGATEDLADKLETTVDDFITVMTHCHSDDYEVVRRVLRKPFFYLGVIGSPRKALEIRKKLAADGFTNQEIQRMTCPIGIDIGSHTPDEIAVSVAAQLVSMRNKWTKSKE